jgi:hypothetical protein
MGEIHTVMCMTGGYEGWSFYEVASFHDKHLAETLAANAQLVADTLIERFGGEVFGAQGLNPHDPRMSLEPGRIVYQVRSMPVLSHAPADPANKADEARVLYMSPTLSALPTIANTLQVALEHLDRNYEYTQGAPATALRKPQALAVLLASVEVSGQVFDLTLEGEFEGKPWDEEKGEYLETPALLSDFSRDELCLMRDRGKLPEAWFWDEARLDWCARGESGPGEWVDLLATSPRELVGQLLRLLHVAALRT